MGKRLPIIDPDLEFGLTLMESMIEPGLQLPVVGWHEVDAEIRFDLLRGVMEEA